VVGACVAVFVLTGSLPKSFSWGEVDKPNGFESWQKHLLVDIVLTAALLGGGADGIHKIISVYTNAAEQKKAEIEGRSLREGKY
jgi:hypothetical protein